MEMKEELQNETKALEAQGFKCTIECDNKSCTYKCSKRVIGTYEKYTKTYKPVHIRFQDPPAGTSSSFH